MSILIDKTTKVICQGITGKAGRFHTRQCLDYGTQVVAGVTPGKGGSEAEGLPVFNSCSEAVDQTGASVSMVYVPARFAYDAVRDALDAGIRLVVIITEGIPVKDMMIVREYAKDKGARIIGPNCPGIITSEECKIGIMPGYIHKKGCVGVVSRSGTLTYEAVWQITSVGLGQTTSIGIGGDPVLGTNFIDCLKLFEQDNDTEAVLLIGEIGGSQEEEAAAYIQRHLSKKVAAFVAGATAPKEKRMGHAGAIISGSSGTAQDKHKAFRKAGVTVIKNPSDIGKTLKEIMG